jgi:hypothetical protein
VSTANKVKSPFCKVELNTKDMRLGAAKAREILFQAIANGSVVSWQHINLWANTISRTKSSRIRSGSSPQN